MTTTRPPRPRRRRGVVLAATSLAVCLGVLVSLLVWSSATTGGDAAPSNRSVGPFLGVEARHGTETPQPGPVDAPEPGSVPQPPPVRLLIPAIEVDAPLVAVGLEPDGAMAVPAFGVAGWYAEGPAPGEPGPAAIVAHVSSRRGPDVFARLGELTVGDGITVVDAQDNRARFVVTESEQAAKDALPVESIWPVTTEPRLALITCAGTFDRTSGHYTDNLVVYAVVAPPPVPAAAR